MRLCYVLHSLSAQLIEQMTRQPDRACRSRSAADAAAVSRDATNPYSATLPRTDRHGEVVRERYSAECVKGSYSINTNSLGSGRLSARSTIEGDYCTGTITCW
jgi:hypothetical protein